MLNINELDWFGNDIKPKNDSIILVNFINEEYIPLEIIKKYSNDFKSKIFPAIVSKNNITYRNDTTWINVWFGIDEQDFSIKCINKWAYMPTLNKDISAAEY